jgi:hypothetical protein
MARKFGGRGGGRSKAHRVPTFRSTCKGCGVIATVIVRPPPGVDLYCVACDLKRRGESAAAVAAAAAPAK